MKTLQQLYHKFFVLMCLMLICSSVSAQVRINSGNLSNFTSLSKKFPYPACYREDSFKSTLGKINKYPLIAGRIFREVSIEAMRAQVTSLTAKKRALQKKKRPDQRKIRKLSEAISNLKKDIRTFTSVNNKCTPQEIEPTPTSIPNTTPTFPAPLPTSTPNPGDMGGSSQSLSPYHETLTNVEVDHILRKVAFGGSEELKAIGRTQGLSALVDALVDGVGGAAEDNRINNESNFWSSQFFYIPSEGPQDPSERIWTTEAAQIGEFERMMRTRNPLRDWMLLVLAGHYSTSFNKIGFSYSGDRHYGIQLHLEMLRRNSLGNLKTLATDMLTDPAMNFWLNNKDNSAGSPNQNFGRELMELFILGARDPVTGVANYDQSSVIATTAFVSGYFEDTQSDPLNGKDVVHISYDNDLHDAQAYTLFTGMNGLEINASLTPAGVINYIFTNHPGAPRYIADRIAGQILYPGLPENIIAELATTLKNNNYELKPFLKKILKSQIMFSSLSKNSCITSPIESVVSLARKFFMNQALPTVEGDLYNSAKWGLYDVVNSSSSSGQALFDPPSVFGWKGSCNINRASGLAYGEGWLPPQKLFNRSRGCFAVMNMFNGVGGDLLTTLAIEVTDTLPVLINKIADKVFGVSLTAQQQTVLMQFMLEYLDDNGVHQPIEYDLSDQWYRWRKIPRLVCLMYDLVETNSK